MFQLLLDIGQSVARRERKSDVAELLRDPIPQEYRNAVVISFDRNAKRYLGSEAIELSPSERDAILYKKGAPNGFDATAVSLFGGVTDRTVRRVGKSIDAIATWAEADDTSPESAATLVGVATSYNEQIDQISEDVSQAVTTIELNVENRGLLLVACNAGTELDPVWSWPITRRFLVERAMEQYGSYSDEPCAASDCPCSLCARKRSKVFGNFSELKSYILDKPGMIAGGFTIPHAVHNFPVCPECAAHVALGINYSESHLTFKMAHQTYLMLPQCQSDEIRDEFLDICEHRESTQTDSLHEDTVARLSEDENEILDEVCQRFGADDQISLKLVFFKKNKGEWKINAEIDQVLPSRIQEVFKAKVQCERRAWRHEKEFISTDLVREFAGGSFTNSQRDVLAHIDAIFSDKTLDERRIMRNMVDEILTQFRRDGKRAGYTVRRAFMLHDFYRKLGIIPSQRGEPMGTDLAEKSVYGRFLDENAEFFGTPEKRVAFLTGALVRCVMNAQYEKLGSTPFEKKLKGIRITEAVLKRLLGEAKHKLQVYDADHYPSNRDLLELLSEQWIASGASFDLSEDDATFQFTLGLNLNYYITREFAKKEN